MTFDVFDLRNSGLYQSSCLLAIRWHLFRSLSPHLFIPKLASWSTILLRHGFYLSHADLRYI